MDQFSADNTSSEPPIVQRVWPTINGVVVDDEKIVERNFRKNMGVISVGFMFFFTGYNAVNAVQSSLNNDRGLGTTALSVKYASQALGNLVSNNYLVHKLGCKRSICVGMLVYCTYLAANFYPAWATLLPSGMIAGTAAATMWMAHGLYLTKHCNAIIELRLPDLSAEERAESLAKLKYIVFGVFNFFIFASNALGNAASSLILPLVNNNSNANATWKRLQLCGADYCNEDIGSKPMEQDKIYVYGLCTFCLSCGIVGVLLTTLFMDGFPKLGIPDEAGPGSDKTTWQRLTATVKHWRHPYQLLLIPLGLYNGLNGNFWTAEFTQSFVTCTVGVHYVGFVMVCYSVTAMLSICLFTMFSYISKKSYRSVSYLVGLSAHMSVLVTMLYWKPTPDDLTVLYIMSAIWGVGCVVWYPMLYAFYSVVFQKDMESAFSNFHLWYTVGAIMAYGWSYGLCVRTKIYLMMGFLCVGVTCILGIEVHMLIIAARQQRRVEVIVRLTSSSSSGGGGAGRRSSTTVETFNSDDSTNVRVRNDTTSLPDTLAMEALIQVHVADGNFRIRQKHRIRL